MHKNDFIYRPQRLLKPVRSFCFIIILFSVISGRAQNTISKIIDVDAIDSIEINGNQIFTISVKTYEVDTIKIVSTLDGEFQNEFQVVDKIEGKVLFLKLEHQSFSEIADDKRNAHKVIAATLQLEIPEHLSVIIKSDVGSINAMGNFKDLLIESLQGFCKVNGTAKNAVINTINGNITVSTTNANVKASSNNGNVEVDEFESLQSQWQLKSINGDITVKKQE